MIPRFPQFKKLELTDKEEVESFTAKYPPYSDFNFVSMWSWDTEEKMEISQLNGNLVVKFQDYLDNTQFFYSFLGINKVNQTIEALLGQAKKEKLLNVLKLVPEIVVQNTKNNQWLIKEDTDNYDNILSVEKITAMKGKKLHAKKKWLNIFLRSYTYASSVLSLKDKDVQKQLLDLFFRWEKMRGKNRQQTNNELQAIKKLFTGADCLNVEVLTVSVNNLLIGYTIFENLKNGYTMSSFQKADLSYQGIFEFMNWELANYLKKQGGLYLNIEQDLGIPSLRRAKKDYNPSFLKKYSIQNLHTLTNIFNNT